MSSEAIAVSVQDLSKSYTIAHNAVQPTSLGEAIMQRLKTPRGRAERETFWALSNVNFDIKQGEVVGIIGRNGAGKSTLLKILSQITEPTTGKINLYGRLASLLEVGTGFHPELTGRENIYLNGAILGMTRKEVQRKFDEIVDFAGVEQFLDTPVKRYSSGMYVRLAFAVAANLEPDILVVDEVLAVGDSEFQKKCLGKMGEIGKSGRTVLLVSHNIPSVINLCQRAILLESGKIVQDGASHEVAQHYLATVRSVGGEVVWSDPQQAPGTDIAKLFSVRVLQEGVDGPTADVDISKEILIEFTYCNLKEGAYLYPAMWLRDYQGTVVFASSNHKAISLTLDTWSGEPHPVGHYQSRCRIPGNFLNEGQYSVTAILGLGTADTQAFEDYAVSFTVHDTGAMREVFFGGWIGTVRPQLAWDTQRI